MVAFLQKLNNSRCFNLNTGKMPSLAPSPNAKFLPPLTNNDRDHRNHFQDPSSNRSTSSVFNNNNNNNNGNNSKGHNSRQQQVPSLGINNDNNNNNNNNNGNNSKGHNSRQQQVPSLGIINRLAQGMPPLNQENRAMPGKMNLPSKVRDGAPSVPLQQQQQPDQERVWMERFQNQNVMLWERVRHLEQTINKLEKNSAQLVDLNSKLEVELHEQIEKNKTLVHKNTSIVLDTSAKDQQINSLQEQKVLLMKQNSKLQSYLRSTDEFIGSIQSQHELIEIEHHHRQQQQHQQRQKLMELRDYHVVPAATAIAAATALLLSAVATPESAREQLLKAAEAEGIALPILVPSALASGEMNVCVEYQRKTATAIDRGKIHVLAGVTADRIRIHVTSAIEGEV
eukprot:CAMPEP_0172378956 /NCGR_PEP_ID=MMETSP1060-20121228/69684_1 /TAXON_ID=37318 /ORGANISM="Pseudo-nitzschia pungens, Strain cf. cingulata" /LENGTH=396 /DNA_ID=CAMNT_0013106689 /DNA_START=212 /DNA_END=1403 /DNA_ORIENTATION=-